MTHLSSENQTRTANHLAKREGPGVSCPEDQKGSVSTEKLNLPSLQKIKRVPQITLKKERGRG